MKYIFLSFLVVGSLFMTSCRKKKDTIANIQVLGTNNQPVNQCMVILYGENTTGLPQTVAVFDTSYTNENGVATFNYNDIFQLGQAGVAVLNIKAQKGSEQGIGIIKIESERVNEETVFIQ